MRLQGRVKRSFPIEGSDDRIVLVHWAHSDEPRLRNLYRIDRRSLVLWQADLPGDAAHDCFVHLEREGAAFVASTYAGCVASFDAEGRTTSELRLAA